MTQTSKRLYQSFTLLLLGFTLQVNAGETHHTLAFDPVKIPQTDEEKRSILATDGVTINGKHYPLGYHTILRSGDKRKQQTFGLLIDANGKPITNMDGSTKISNSNDFASLLSVEDSLFMVSHFEDRPGAMYLTQLEQNPKTGKLTALTTQPIDFSAVKGGWVHCAGSVTPWQTHLGSEEYEPDAAAWDQKTGKINYYYDAMANYFQGDLHKTHPYYYGYPVEVQVRNAAGDTQVTKHYAMGRMALELAYVLPDQKTVYLSDDGTNVGLFLFIADTPGDLSAGTLYAAKWQQTSADNGGTADLSWINLGHANNAEIAAYLQQNIQFGDIFTKTLPTANGQCPTDFTSVNVGHQPDENGLYHQCLKLQPGMEKAASRLETRRYAAMLGATTELRKEEGITYSPDTNQLFVAISEIGRGMENFHKKGKANETFDVGGPNDIRLPYNHCGGVYALDLAENKTLGSQYVGQNMQAILVGKPKKYEGDWADNSCDLDGIANPDNLTYIPGYHTLIIGEDTGSGHQNDMIWAFNLNDQTLTRIQTTPYGSETTSPYFYPNIGGWGYLMSVVQHPFGESDRDKLKIPAESFAYTGYIGAFPALTE